MKAIIVAWGVLGAVACGGEAHPAALQGIAEISIGPNHACARLESGAVKCWGNNYSGQLGDGTSTDALTPASVDGIRSASDISANGDSSCAVLSDGSAKCWGVNFVPIEAPLMRGSLLPLYGSALPRTIPGIVAATRISIADSYHSCLVEDGRVQCWGRNTFGQLGDGTTEESSDPVSVLGLVDALEVSANGFASCALVADGHVYCWGSTLDLAGNVAPGNVTTPVEVTGLTDVAALTLGTYHACALRAGGTVACWGRNYELELGTENAGNQSMVPVEVDGLSNVVKLSAGTTHTCAVVADGSAWCWGTNDFGQLGSGEKSETALPTQVRGLGPVESVAAGWDTTCAVLRDHTARCWGRNTYGALGNGTTRDSATPVTLIE